jgi:thiol-disulfide isomerase/thioredoxin
MDRLPAVAVRAALALVPVLGALGCGGGAQEPVRSRVEGVKAAATPDVARFCDATWSEETAPVLSLPRVEPARPGTTVPALARDRFIWINLWATWCGPCRREMPLVIKFAERLQAEGVAVDLWFISIDDRAEDLSRFLQENPGVAPGSSVRVVSQKEFATWMKQYTSAEASSIPINLVAAPGGRLRCIRVGSLRDGDYPTVKAVFR